MKDFGFIKVETPKNGEGYLITTPDLETIHTTWGAAEIRINKYIEGLRRRARQSTLGGSEQ